MQPIPMTLRGAERLREELDFLKSVRRPEIIAAIADAREHGDLKENAEYHAAREQQGFCEGRIQDIEAKLSNAQVIDVTKMPNNGRVIFGATVTVLNLENDEEQAIALLAMMRLILNRILFPLTRLSLAVWWGKSRMTLW